MLISERQLRSIVREMLNEQGSLASGSGSTASGPVTSSRKKGKGGYEYEIFSNGKIQIVSKRGKTLAAPKVLNQAQAIAVAKEQIALGNKGSLLSRIASGELVFSGGPAASPAAAPAVPAVAAGTGPQKGVILIGRQEYSPVAALAGPKASAIADKLFGQGHGFAVVVDPSNGRGHRFDFGRYPEAEKCEDTRWLTQAGVALATKFGMGNDPDPEKRKSPKQWFGGLGISTMGVLHHNVGRVPAVLGPDGQITNMKSFCAGLKIGTDKSGTTQIVAVPVNDAAGALQFAMSKKMVCFPYALPGAQVLTYKDTENCGTMAQKILEAGSPNMSVSIETKTLVDTPDALYNTLASGGTLQTSGF
jgi:hypothetical protein